MHIVYARGLDPDQDVYEGGGYGTINTIPASNMVTAIGPKTLYSISIVDLTGFGVPSIYSTWYTDPYILLQRHNDGDGDNTINMAWDLGRIDPGRSKEIDFKYSINVVPIPSTALLLGSALLGMAGLVRMKRKG
jgi:hypothetical protein